jgi:hypothetical protein
MRPQRSPERYGEILVYHIPTSKADFAAGAMMRRDERKSHE